MTTTVDPQPTLFDEVVVTHHRPTAEEAFLAYRKANPGFMGAVDRKARELWAQGNTRLSMKAIFELLRMEGEFKRIDNSWSALCTRRLIDIDTTLAHLFVTRKRRGK